MQIFLKSMKKSQVGLTGLGTMGTSLARNIASRGITTSIHNRTPEKVDLFLKTYGASTVQGFHEIRKWIRSLEKPRKIILMVPAGEAEDEMIGKMKKLPGERRAPGKARVSCQVVRKKHGSSVKKSFPRLQQRIFEEENVFPTWEQEAQDTLSKWFIMGLSTLKCSRSARHMT